MSKKGSLNKGLALIEKVLDTPGLNQASLAMSTELTADVISKIQKTLIDRKWIVIVNKNYFPGPRFTDIQNKAL